ncbi:MAG: hypothetical protein Q4C13_02095 [Clostridia bacterium]|nr:hypothetical protein [Clostridia bacterium]
MEDILPALKTSLLTGLSRATGRPAAELRLRLPGRAAAAACPLVSVMDAGVAAALLGEDAFAPVLGVLPVRRVEAKNGWLLFTLSDAFYSAAVRHVRATLPPAAEDLGGHALNRMLCLSRRGGDGCPADERVQRAWLLTLCCAESRAALRRAERALTHMTHHRSPRERAALREACGGMADAAGRILYRTMREMKERG